MVRKETIETRNRHEAKRAGELPKEKKMKVPKKMTVVFKDELLLKIARKLDLIEE